MLERMDLHNLVLRPNCLMTKNPIVFLNGPRSLFFYEKLGGTLQDFIAEHGYQVFCPPLPFRGSKLRKTALDRWLQSQNSKTFHFVVGPKTFDEFKDLLVNFPDSTITLSESFTAAGETNKITPLQYQLHVMFCRISNAIPEEYSCTFPDKSRQIYERFLDRCVELAENE